MTVTLAVLHAVLLASAAAPSAKVPSPKAPGVLGGRTVVLDAPTARGAITIRTARNVLTTVELPEDVQGALRCVGCAIGAEANADALFLVEQLGDGRYIGITPNVDASRHSRAAGALANLIVHLEHATLMLKLVRVEASSAADMRVVLAYPDRKNESEYVRVEKAKLVAEGAAKTESQVNDKFLRAFAEPHHCERKGARSRSDDIVVEVTELCYFGQDVIMAFTVENRGRIPLEIKTVTVSRGTNKREYLSDNTVEFDKMSRGVVSLQLPNTDTSGKFDLTVTESTGKHRSVTVGGVEF